MKRQLSVLAALILLGAAPAGAAAPVQIVVDGSGSVASIPDTATVSASTVTTAPAAATAVAANNDRYAEVLAAVQKLGVDRRDVTLSYYNVSYDQKQGYTVSRAFDIKLGKLALSGPAIDAISAVDATTIAGVSFGLADTSKVQAQATALAVADARAKAQILAQAAGLHIVGIKQISQGGDGVVRPMARLMTAAAPTVLDPSSVNTNADVTIIFLAR